MTEVFDTRNVRNFARVRDFVRQDLGCGCPEEIFADIDLTLPELGQDRLVYKKLIIGRRLLIAILPCDDPATLQHLLPQLVQQLRQERDSMGYNRVRIVIAATEPILIQLSADLLFQGLNDIDERMHLHILPADHLLGIE